MTFLAEGSHSAFCNLGIQYGIYKIGNKDTEEGFKNSFNMIQL